MQDSEKATKSDLTIRHLPTLWRKTLMSWVAIITVLKILRWYDHDRMIITVILTLMNLCFLQDPRIQPWDHTYQLFKPSAVKEIRRKFFLNMWYQNGIPFHVISWGKFCEKDSRWQQQRHCLLATWLNCTNQDVQVSAFNDSWKLIT